MQRFRRDSLLLGVALTLVAATPAAFAAGTGGPKAPATRAPPAKVQPPVAKPQRPTAYPVLTPAANAGEAPKIDLGKLPPNERLRAAPVGRSPQMQAVVLAALRRFVSGGAKGNAIDEAVAKALSRHPKAKVIARRIVQRIDRLPPPQRAKLIGKGGVTELDGKTLAAAAAMAGLVYTGVGEPPADVLPAEDVPPPASYHLAVSGVAPLELGDGDADGDELVVMTSFVHQGGTMFEVDTASVPDSGSLDGVQLGDPKPFDAQVYDGWAKVGLLVSAVAEADGDASVIREDYALMLSLAQALAEQLSGNADPIETKMAHFAFALDYTIGLLAIANPGKWPQGSVTKTMLSGPTSLHELYSLPAASDGTVPWKLAHDHDLPQGHYKVYFDVPAPPLDRPTVVVKINRYESLDPEASGDDLMLRVGIGNQYADSDLPADKNVHTKTWTIKRDLAPNATKTQVWLMADEFDDAPAYGWITDGWGASQCGDWNDGKWYPDCPDIITALDIDPTPASGEGWFYDPANSASFEIDLGSGAITGTVSGQLGEPIVLQGEMPGYRAKIKLTISVVP